MTEPLDPATAKALATEALANGRAIIGDHMRKRMAARRVTLAEVHRLIKGGAYGQGENENGSWRYPVWSGVLVVVIAFRGFDPPTIVFVTCFRSGK